jgi:H+/Cl- antiporter ClcA
MKTLRIGKKVKSISSANAIAVIYVVAGIGSGLCAYLVSRVFGWAEHLALSFYRSYPVIFAVLAPLFFLASAHLVFRYAKYAGGSGIPQVMYALERINRGDRSSRSIMAINGIRTAVVKLSSAVLALMGGASIGREGPSAQIAAGVFQAICYPFRRWTGKLELRSMLVAGASSGIAAAFNAPLAGVTFALEELAPQNFRDVKNAVLLAIIVAGGTTQALMGNYVYFGQHMTQPTPISTQILACVLVGISCGLLSSLFCRLTIHLRKTIASKTERQRRYLVPISISLAVLAMVFLTHGQSMGPGRELALSALQLQGELSAVDVVGKFISTLLSFVSGIAGGIFAPSLSIGAGIGNMVAGLDFGSNVVFCGILGMAAFLTGVTQAPLTSIIIVTEMTDKHDSVLPIMCVSLVSFVVARATQRGSLYHMIAELLEQQSAAAAVAAANAAAKEETMANPPTDAKNIEPKRDA